MKETSPKTYKMNKIDTINSNNFFADHISKESNSKIIFSGEFGSGKTTFLKDFFDTNDNQYMPYWLSPVNYSVAAN